MNPLISIIVPVYNASETLGETLDSLLNQSHHNIEVICINDGSLDASEGILKSYAVRDSRVRILQQENQGVSAARNTGIAQLSPDSEVVMFVDADDKLTSRACEQIASVFHQESPDVFTFGLACDPPEAETTSLKRDFEPPANKTYEPFSPDLLFKENSRPYACRTALSSDFVKREQVHFEPGIALGEDQVFYFATYPFSRKTVLSSNRLYLYRMNQDSATHQECSFARRVDQHLLALAAITRTWDKRNFRDESCMKELLLWSLEFFMLDISKLPKDSQRSAWGRFLTIMDDYLGKTERYATKFFAKRCLKNIRSTGSVEKVNLTAFYLGRLGLERSIERVLIKTGMLN